MFARKSTPKREAVLPGDPTVEYPYLLPYGFAVQGGKLVRKDDEAEVVKRVFVLAAAGDKDAGQIAAEVPGQDAESVVRLVANPVYKGDWRGVGSAERLVGDAEWDAAQGLVPPSA